MPPTNFWISTVSETDGTVQLTGLNRAQHHFTVRVKEYEKTGPSDFDDQIWDEGSFLAWDTNTLWQIEITLTIGNSVASSEGMTPDDEFRYDEYGLSPIVFSQITGAIVANL